MARIPVTEISLGSGSLAQFDLAPMTAAATLLADARVHALCWNGTSAGWLGLDRDRDLAVAVAAATGIPTTTAVLAIREALHLTGSENVGLVTPYADDVQARVLDNLRRDGVVCVADRRLGITENFAFAEVPETTVERMIREVAADGARTVVVLCTNLRGARLARRLEDELGVLVLDSVAVALWGAMRAAGADPSQIKGWGRLFALS